MLFACVALALTQLPAPTPVCDGCVPVFYGGLNNSACFRIPTAIRTSKGTILAFADNRKDNCGDNGKQHDLVLRRSSDGGKTWGPMLIAMQGKVPCPGCPAAISNPNPVEVTLADGSKKILLHYDTMNNPSKAHHGLDMQTWSSDDGVTWETGTVLSYPPADNVGGLIGPSVGIQAASGAIYFSQVEQGGHWLYWSKDFGKTWASSAPLPGLGECSITWLVSAEDGRIIMNCRTNAHDGRAQVVWSPEGVPGNVTHPHGLIDPGCQGSITNQNGTLYTSNDNTQKGRFMMTIKRSVDQGRSWSTGTLIHKGPSGYSQLVPMGDKNLGLLFECGTRSTYDTISFVTRENPQ